MGAVLAGRPVVEAGGSKDSLAPKSRTERAKVAVGYIRDRDFDFEPPEDQTRPTVDRADEQGPFGWRWCRHEIESYLLDPQIVAAASPLNRDEYVDALVGAARRIRHYQIARWVIGSARRTLPPRYDLPTRPAGFERDFHLPVDMNAAPIFQWAKQHAADFLAPVVRSLSPAALDAAIGERSELITDARLGDFSEVLTWCSAKDLLAALKDGSSTGVTPVQAPSEVCFAIGPSPTLKLRSHCFRNGRRFSR